MKPCGEALREVLAWDGLPAFRGGASLKRRSLSPEPVRLARSPRLQGRGLVEADLRVALITRAEMASIARTDGGLACQGLDSRLECFHLRCERRLPAFRGGGFLKLGTLVGPLAHGLDHPSPPTASIRRDAKSRVSPRTGGIDGTQHLRRPRSAPPRSAEKQATPWPKDAHGVGKSRHRPYRLTRRCQSPRTRNLPAEIPIG